MRIRFVPPSPKAGLTEHCENTAGRALILAGLAEEVKYTDFRDRLRCEASPAATPSPVEWGVLDRDQSRFSIVRVVKREGSTTTYFSAPPNDAPQGVKDKFAALNAPQPDPEALREAKVQEGYRQAERDKKERATILGTILGVK